MNISEIAKVSQTQGDKEIEIVLRSVKSSDAKEFVAHEKRLCGEAKYLITTPEEVSSVTDMTLRLSNEMHDGNKCRIIALDGDKIIGSAHYTVLDRVKSTSHRVRVGIGIEKDYTSKGLGKALLTIVLEIAKEQGYEQAELEMLTENDIAFKLYDKLGFEVHGTFPNAVKRADGTYADTYFMVKRL